ncbi:MAG: hypothetical protein NT070_14630 [Cyanobacteria bacterium]|nr:hypothetical protein [Cyanobacteriota bacterium]
MRWSGVSHAVKVAIVLGETFGFLAREVRSIGWLVWSLRTALRAWNSLAIASSCAPLKSPVHHRNVARQPRR